MKEKINIRFVVLILVTQLVGLFRILTASGHIPFSNFTPIGALALFGGAYFINKSRALLLPLASLFISDAVLMKTVYAKHSNGILYSGWYWTYAAFALMVVIGKYGIPKVNIKNVLLSGIGAALAHFIITDFGVWLGGGLDITTGLPYTRDINGLIKCYILAIPFFKNLLAGNLIFGAVLFGGYELAKRRYHVLEKIG